MKFFEWYKAHIKSWCNNPEEWAIKQAKELTKLDFIFKHVALMPDTHQWYLMPIWWVIATKLVIIPNAVGVDIWCWMRSIKTSLKYISEDDLKKIMWTIRDLVPVWFKKHKEPLMLTEELTRYAWKIWKEQMENAWTSLWTLWGWNHFIEIQKWSDWHIWIMIHTWSRNLWKQIADYYHKKATELNTLRNSSTIKDCWFLPLETRLWKQYMAEMQYAVQYAKLNRKTIATAVKSSFIATLWEMEFAEDIDVAHNYARMENHYWQNVLIHRKWATSAKEGEIGIIPWSQGTKSYLVIGKWNKESYNSCSHWAGRKMSRTQAKKNLSLEDEIKILDKQWIIHWIKSKDDLDEAPSSYKDIDIVMEEQKDLVEIRVEFTPLAVIKW